MLSGNEKSRVEDWGDLDEKTSINLLIIQVNANINAQIVVRIASNLTVVQIANTFLWNGTT